MRIKICFLFVLSGLILLSFPCQAQSVYKKKKPKNSYAQGTLDFSWGYNRSAYSRSSIRFVGEQYDIRLKGVQAKDDQLPFSGKYFNPTRFTVPQYNIRIGYNIRNFWSLSVGYDHMKYVLVDGQTAGITGFVEPGADPLWSGTYSAGQERDLNKPHFHYQNTDGLNYVRVQLSRNVAPFKKLRDGIVGFNWIYGVSAGALVSFTDYTFEGYRSERTSSLSGYGLSLHSGFRFVFWKHFFLQANFAGGLMHQVKAKTRPVDGHYASHVFTYGAVEGLFGFLFYIRPTNDCNSCPQW